MDGRREDVAHALARARDGDADALAQVWRAYQAPLLRYLRARRSADAEDVATEVWLDVARGLARFAGDGDDFRRWLFTIAHRRLVDHRRRWARRAAAPPPDAPTASPAADVEFDDQDALARAVGLVGRLPEPMREAVLLRVVADLSVADTASIMGVRPGNARVLVHRGLRRLETMLGGGSAMAVTLAEAPTMKGSA